MTTLTFYNGLREIGGTFVVVETDEARCMFDFGFAVMDRMDDKIAVRYNECAGRLCTSWSVSFTGWHL